MSLPLSLLSSLVSQADARVLALQTELNRALSERDALATELRNKTAAEAAAAEAEAEVALHTFWAKKTISLASDADIQSVTQRIDEGAFSSSIPSVCWDKDKKHHPTALYPAHICGLLKAAPERSLTFGQLFRRAGMSKTGPHKLQNYLREMKKQGLIIVA
jgi:hypothetical protein